MPRGDDDPPGDPCVLRLREAVAAGAIPFSCQGPDNGLTIDGGRTLGYELADAHVPLDHLVVQVGGGALASSVAQGLTERGRARRHRIDADHPRRASRGARADGAGVAAPASRCSTPPTAT